MPGARHARERLHRRELFEPKARAPFGLGGAVHPGSAAKTQPPRVEAAPLAPWPGTPGATLGHDGGRARLAAARP